MEVIKMADIVYSAVWKWVVHWSPALQKNTDKQCNGGVPIKPRNLQSNFLKKQLEYSLTEQ